MYSFTDIKTGDIIQFNDVHELTAFPIHDIATDEITGYVCEYEEQTYPISKETFDAISILK